MGRSRIPRNEIGASICQRPDGSYTFGPWAKGTPTNVNVPVQCPPGSRFTGIIHSHPGGIPIPSKTDVQSGRKVGAEQLCIISDSGSVHCYRQLNK